MQKLLYPLVILFVVVVIAKTMATPTQLHSLTGMVITDGHSLISAIVHGMSALWSS
jgi:hypothetical protein